MSTPTLITVPASACYSSVTLSMESVVGRTTSPFTREEQAFRWPGSQWQLDLSMPPMKSRALVAEWKSFFMALEGSFNVFLMGDPAEKTPRGVATGTPLVDGANQEGTALATKGWTNSTAGILKAGDYIQIGTGLQARLHMLTQDANSDGSGDATLMIQPSLRFSPTDNTPITVTNARGVFRLVGNTVSWSVTPGKIWRMGFQAIEVVNA